MIVEVYGSRTPFSVIRGIRFVRGRRECQQVTGLALQCSANGLQRRESYRARLSGFQDRQVGERDPDLFGKLRQRHATVVEHVVQLDDDRHVQTVPSRSSRMRAPCSNTRASTKSISTASHRVSERSPLMRRGVAVVEIPAATAPTVRCSSSSASTAQAILFRRSAFATTKGFPTETVSTMARSRVRTKCTSGIPQRPITMIRRTPAKSIELPGAGRTPSAFMTGPSDTRVATNRARMKAAMSRFSLVRTRRTPRVNDRVSGDDRVMRPSFHAVSRLTILSINDKLYIVCRQVK